MTNEATKKPPAPPGAAIPTSSTSITRRLDDLDSSPTVRTTRTADGVPDVVSEGALEPLVVPPDAELRTMQFAGEPIRVLVHDGAVTFIAKDACGALGFGNHRQAVSSLDDDEKGVHIVDTPGGRQEMTVISEAGIYRLVANSRLPAAKAFDRWVRHEVLPSIRKTGRYEMPAAKLSATEERLQRAEARKLAKFELDREMAAAKRGKMLLDAIPRHLVGDSAELARKAVVARALNLIAGEKIPELLPESERSVEPDAWYPEDLVAIGVAKNVQRVGLAITAAGIRGRSEYGITTLGDRKSSDGQCDRFRMNVAGLRLVVDALRAKGWLERYPAEFLDKAAPSGGSL